MSQHPSRSSTVFYNDDKTPHHDSTRPTPEERLTLRRVPGSIPIASFLVAICELSERFSYYGCVQVFTNFIQQPLPHGSRTGAGGHHRQSGALGQGQRASFGLTTFNTFWVYTVPLFGAYIADTHLGRYKTICWSVVIAIVGHILLVVSAIPDVIVHPKSALGIFSVALVIMGLGTGGFKSTISPLVGEQVTVTEQRIAVLPSGERVIVDPAMTIARMYRWFYLFINVGALLGEVGMSFTEKYQGFWLAFLLPTIVFLLNPIVLYCGRNKYVRTPPTGSVLSEAFRLWRFAARGRWSWNPVRTWKQLTADDFWTSVKPSQLGDAKPKWMTFDDKWVDEVRRGLKACKVFTFFPLYWVSHNQLSSNLVSQAATLQNHGLPNEIIGNLDPFALILLIPLFDFFVYPFLAKRKINFSPIKRITAGFFMGSFAMIWAAVLQHYIYQKSPCGNHAGGKDASGQACHPAPMTVWLQSGAYLLIAVSEIFASISGLEYAYTKAPSTMRSLVMSVFFFQSALAAALSQALVAINSDPLLVVSYAVYAGCAGIGGILFYLSFRTQDREEDALNSISESHGDEGVVHDANRGVRKA